MPLLSCIPLGCRGGVDIIDHTQCSLEEIPAEVDRSAHTLEELYLDGNKISEISEKLARCRKLRTLSLAQNKLLRVPSFIGCLKALEELHLEDNELTDLPLELEDCTSLQILDLRLNLFLRLPDVVTRLDSLTQLHLFETSLTQLPADIGYLQNLRYLDVRENQLRVLPPSICDLKNLKQLDVGRNELLLLPMGLGVLEDLEELYADHNLLNAIPDSVVNCRGLKVLDISENDILSLPEDLGELVELGELNFSENRITSMPNSISRLKKLTVLKADSNSIAMLTTAIGGCTALRELYLANNQLTSVPSALGNLEFLTLLTLDENRLTEIPSTIGGCKKLSILSLRSNHLNELPLEIGRLDSLNVLDVCDNHLMFLPFTMTVLPHLRALWLSVDQTVSRVPLTVALDPVTHVKVLTCYLLPQGMGQEATSRQRRTESNVHFGEEGEGDAEGELEHSGFVRRGTPHPKPRSRVGVRRQSIDGRYIPHNKEEENQDQKLLLRRKSMGDSPNPTTLTAQTLKQDSIEDALKIFQEIASPKEKLVREVSHSVEDLSKCVPKEHSLFIRKNEKSGFGLTMAGGCDSEPYKDNDNGLFISKILEGGAAASAGLQVGDKIVAVNGVSVANECHETAVKLMQSEGTLHLVVTREEESASLSEPHKAKQAETKNEERVTDAFVETISTTMQRDMEGSLGFDIDLITDTVTGNVITVSSVKNYASKLCTGDHILSINGKSTSNMNLVDANKALGDDGEREVYLIVQRKHPVASCATSPTVASNGNGDIKEDEEQKLVDLLPITKTSGDDNACIDDSSQSVVSSTSIDTVTVVQDEDSLEKRDVGPSGRKAPPVAPKPKGFKLVASANADTQVDGCEDVNTAEPSKLTFSSKIKKFESATQVVASRGNGSGIPAKKPLVSEEDMLKLKEEERNKAFSFNDSLLSDSEDNVNGATFDELLEMRPGARKSPTVIRTKKAEIRMDSVDGCRKAVDDLEKRQKWRQARYKSLEVATARTESVMEQVREISSRLGMVTEEGSNLALSPNGDFAHNGGEENFANSIVDCSGGILNENGTGTATLGVS